MSRFSAMVLANEEIMPATHVLTLDAGPRARNAAPGQFLHIRCGGPGVLLRRPMSIYRAEGEMLQLMIRNVGLGSSWLTSRAPGEGLDCLGPQGHGFHLDGKAHHLLMVGGGYGVAPLVGLAERALRRGASVTLAVGAATANLVFPVRLLSPEIEYLVATDDGSAGHHGRVTELLPGRLDWADAIYACGPVAMMSVLAALVRKEGKSQRTQIAMEERMGCSMGVCLGCVVETTKGPKRVCTDGPVFDIGQIIWREPPQEAPHDGLEPVGTRNGHV